jgi:hypothetical protein
MKRLHTIATVVLSALLTLWCASSAAGQGQSPLDVVKNYIDLLGSGNYESAVQLWLPSCLERAERFGIQYTGIPVRVDATSRWVARAEQLAGYTTEPVRSMENVGDNAQCVRLQLSSVMQGDVLQGWYYVRSDQGFYWLCYPQDAYAKNWAVQETKYFRLHVHPKVAEYVSAAACAQMDGFVEAVADTLGLLKTDLANLAAKKIEFFYCDRDSTVMDITGQLTKGLLDLASNDIISASFPHHHEIIHLLVNIKLKTLPLYTLPMLREGLAVRFGGRWGKGPATLLDLGAFLYRDTLVQLDSMLTVRGFDSGSEMDLMYPVAGVMAAYLWDKLGKQRFWPAYLALSGRQDSITRLSIANVQSALVAATGKKTWADFRADFDIYVRDKMSSLSVSASGAPQSGKTLLTDGHNTVTLDGDWLGFTVTADSGALPHASFLFYKSESFGDHKSLLFEEHFQGAVPFAGYHYGVRVDQNEAGAYDYAGNLLVGKFILGINGSEHYFDAQHNTVTVRFKRSLLGKQALTAADITTVPY